MLRAAPQGHFYSRGLRVPPAQLRSEPQSARARPTAPRCTGRGQQGRGAAPATLGAAALTPTMWARPSGSQRDAWSPAPASQTEQLTELCPSPLGARGADKTRGRGPPGGQRPPGSVRTGAHSALGMSLGHQTLCLGAPRHPRAQGLTSLKGSPRSTPRGVWCQPHRSPGAPRPRLHPQPPPSGPGCRPLEASAAGSPPRRG